MQKRRRVKQEIIDKLKGYLVDYIEEWSSINRSKRFRCFNSSNHRRNDADPSAAIVPGSNERSWTCFSCGGKGDIFTAVKHREGIKSFCEQIEFLSRKYGVPIEYEGEERKVHAAPIANKQNLYRYFYQDESGKTVYKIERIEYFEAGVRKKNFSMFKKTDSGWIPGIDGVKRYLYRLPQVLEAINNNDVVFFVEGEKCVHQIIDLGLTGTTTSGGARSWKAHSGEYVAYLKDANVVIIPDNDDSGRQYAEDVLNSLRGIAASARKLELPNLSEKGDIVDWIAAGGTKEEFLKLVSAQEKQGPIFEENFRYYKFYKDKKIKISNFIINPRYMIKGEGQSLIAAELITEDGIILNKVLKG